MTGDFDNDGDTDIVMSSTESSGSPLSFFRNNGSGEFEPAQVIDNDVRGHIVRTRDMNGDGNLDLIYNHGYLKIRLGLGNGSFLPPIDYQRRVGDDFAFVDMTGDGIEDYVNLSESSSLYITPATSVLDYPTEGQVSVASSLRTWGTFEVSDFDRDGHTDILVSRSNRGVLYRGKGALQFEPVFRQFDHYNDVIETILADFDLDGDPDIAMVSGEHASTGQKDTVYWVEGDPTGRFSEMQIIAAGLPTGGSVLPADLDGDGDLDLVVADRESSIRWIRNVSNRPATPILSAESETGGNSQNITRLATPDISGQFTPGAEVTLYSTLDGIVGSAVADGSGLWTITTKRLSDGMHRLSVSTSGGESSRPVEVVVDTRAVPPFGLDLEPSGDSGISQSDDLTNITTPIIRGAAEAGSSIELISSIDGVVGSGIANASFWIQSGPLSHGVHEMTAVATDLAGNTSAPSEVLIVEVDTRVPSVTISSPTAQPEHTTSSLTVDLEGEATDESVITQVEWADERGGSGLAAGTDPWLAGPLDLAPSGTTRFTVSAIDAAGNVGDDSITIEQVVAAESFAAFVARHGLTGADALEGADPDRDNTVNLAEWALGLSNPASGGSLPEQVVRIHEVGGNDHLILCHLRLAGGTLDGETYRHPSAVYVSEGGRTLSAWDLQPVAVPVPDLPAPPAGFEWGCFGLPVVVGDEAFLRLSVSEPAP